MPRPLTPTARLGWLLDGEFTTDGIGPNRQAADQVLAALAAQFTTSDAALLTGFAMLAEAVDADPTNAALWGQYRAAETTLREAAASGDDDAFSKLMAELSADVRNAEVGEP